MKIFKLPYILALSFIIGFALLTSSVSPAAADNNSPLQPAVTQQAAPVLQSPAATTQDIANPYGLGALWNQGDFIARGCGSMRAAVLCWRRHGAACRGKPLLQAEALMRQGDYHAALLKANQASGVAMLTPYETLVAAQVRGAAAAGAHDYAVAATSYQAVLASGTQPPDVQMKLTQAIAGFYYQEQNYPQTIA